MIRSAPSNLSPTSMRDHGLTPSLSLSPCSLTRVLEDKKWDIKTAESSITAEPEGTTSTAISVAGRTRQQGHTRTLLAQPGPNRPERPRRHAAASQLRWHHHQFAVAPRGSLVASYRARKGSPPLMAWRLLPAVAIGERGGRGVCQGERRQCSLASGRAREAQGVKAVSSCSDSNYF
jgi:hypothetical protein